MTTDDAPPGSRLDVFVSVHEAARTYATSVPALRSRARSGALRAYKVDGPHGREWRVSLRSLEAAGFVARRAAEPPGERTRELESQLAGLRRRVEDERRRADRADQELGYAQLEAGRLRAALARAAGGGARTARDEEHERPTDPVLVDAGLLALLRAGGTEVPGPRPGGG